jgi:hypothetical protein
MNPSLRFASLTSLTALLALGSSTASGAIFQALDGEIVRAVTPTLSFSVDDPLSGQMVTFSDFSPTGGGGLGGFGSTGTLDLGNLTVIAGIFVPTGELALSFGVSGLTADDNEEVNLSFEYTATVEDGGALAGAGLFMGGSSISGPSEDNIAIVTENVFDTSLNNLAELQTQNRTGTDNDVFYDTDAFTTSVSTATFQKDLAVGAGEGIENVSHLSLFTETFTVIPEPAHFGLLGGLACLGLGLLRRRARR